MTFAFTILFLLIRNFVDKCFVTFMPELSSFCSSYMNILSLPVPDNVVVSLMQESEIKPMQSLAFSCTAGDSSRHTSCFQDLCFQQRIVSALRWTFYPRQQHFV